MSILPAALILLVQPIALQAADAPVAQPAAAARAEQAEVSADEAENATSDDDADQAGEEEAAAGEAAAGEAAAPKALEPGSSLPVVVEEGPPLPDDLPTVPEEPPGPPPWGPLEILGEEVAPGTVRELALRSSETFSGGGLDIPVVVIRGEERGPTICLTAGVHGDELNGVEIVREVLDGVRPRGMQGTLLGVPIVNIHGFQTSSRYLPDRRDLNRYFPGNPRGSVASRIAHSVFEGVVRHCDALIDLHTGSFHRSNLPQIRADLRHEPSLELARAFGATVVVHSRGAEGTLRRAAQDMGIPAVIYEAGEPMRFQRQEIKRGVIGVRNVLAHRGLVKSGRVSLGEPRVFYDTRWVRAEHGGILVSDVRLGDMVREGDILGTITDPIAKERSVVVSPFHGRIIGMTLAPVMLPGYAAFHIGLPGNRPVDREDPVEHDDRPE